MNFNCHNIVYKTISERLAKAVLASGLPEYSNQDIYKLLSTPPKSDMGDVAFACFPFAKLAKSNPNKIANILLESLQNIGIEDIGVAKVFGPYLNFFYNQKYINELCLNAVQSGELFKTKLVNNAPKSIIEYSQPNTHKVLHVGHMRNICLGKAIVNLYRYAGIETLSTTFPGDVGTHVAKCLWYYKNHNTESIPKEKKGAWLGSMYTLGNNLLEKQRGSDQEEKNREQLTKILKELHSQSGEYFELWKETREWSLELMQAIYDWAGVKFDSWYWESDVDASSVKLIEEYYKKGLFVKDDGAIGIDLKSDKLGFCLLLKSDGTGLYATKDIELARRKFIDHQVEKSIYVVDNRQSLHFKQVFKTLEKMGFENAKDCYHLQYEMVELTDGAMSSRKGNIVALQDLIEQMVSNIKEGHLQKYKDEWSEAEIEDVANTVAKGAIMYGMTRMDSNKKIIFDMDEWLKLDGESGPYIQYVHARICSLIEKVGEGEEVDFSLLTHPLEKEIIKKIVIFNDIIENCVQNNKTHPLCAYLYELSKSFNSFYAECSVLKAESEELKHARLSLVKAVAITLKTGLNILGINAPTKM